MKHFLFLLRMVGLPAIVAVLMLGVYTLAAHAQESIPSYKTDVVISADASARITETIAYDFGAVPLSGPGARHGITRTIPLTAPGSNALISLSDVAVTDGAGVPVPFTNTIVNNAETIRVGDPNSTVTGAHTYVISYVVQGGVRYFPDHDEWYWNAVGDQWPVAVQAASASIALPPSPVSAAPSSTCYTGVIGSRAQACTARIVDGAHAVFATTQPLASGQAFTIVMGFPKRVVAYAPIVDVSEEPVRTVPLAGWGAPYAFVLIVLSIGLVAFLRRRRPARFGSPIPQYTAPAGVSPLEVAALVTNSTRKGLVAQVVSLAARGYMTIAYKEKKTLGIFKTSDFSFTRTAASMPVDSQDGALLDLLFPAGSLTSLLSELTRGTSGANIRGDLRALVEGVYEKLVSDGYLSNALWWKVWKIVILAVFIGVIFVLAFSGAIFGAFGIVGVIVAASILFAGTPWAMLATTSRGNELVWYIRGLKLYISVAEENRIAFHDAPEKNPEHFQELLPYAIALGIEKQWAKKFDGLFTSDQIGWYSGPDAHMAPSLFAQSLTRGFAGSLLGAAGSSGSGGSGFSGSAGAGGGGGGGGGGSW